MSWRIPAGYDAWPRSPRTAGLPERLRACRDLVPTGSRVADVGADHGLLSAALLASGRASYVSAIDLSPKALAGATERLRAWVHQGAADTHCGDGLQPLGERAADVNCAIVAGTGAATAVSVAEAAAAAGLTPARWIMQPNGGLGDVREAMVELGYGVAAERIVAEEHRLFGLVAFDHAGGVRQLRSAIDVVVGPLLRCDSAWEVAAWLEVQETWLAEKLRCATAPAMTKRIARDLQAVRTARASHSVNAGTCVSKGSPRR